MTATTAILLVGGTILVVGGGVYLMSSSSPAGLPKGKNSDGGTAVKSGSTGDWAGQLSGLITAGAGAYDTIKNA